ncbi:MAG TPA: hypothetical protein VMY99_01450 [Nevskiaceae bacterium]|nr:hypothetical protein [Nevskiaceae bacterium]
MEAVQAPLWPYSERNGVGAEAQVQHLFDEPEIVLTAEEERAARGFAHGLFEGYIDEGLYCGSPYNLEAITQTSVLPTQQAFYPAYFKTDKGRQDAAVLGIVPDAPLDELAYKLYEVATMHTVPTETRQDVATKSAKWFRQEMAEQLARDPADDANYIEPQEIKTNDNPQELLDKLADLQQYRMFYRAVFKSIKQESPSHLHEAKEALLRCYMRKLNNRLAFYYPDAIELSQQLAHGPQTAQTITFAQRLQEVLPIAARAFQKEQAQQAQSLNAGPDDFIRRLDLVRNGAAWHNEQLLPVSHEVAALAARYTVHETARELAPEALFSSQEIARMDATVWAADDMERFNKAVLADRGQLSAYETTWKQVDKRSGAAPDSKWQVVVHPHVKSLTVVGSKRVIKIPADFERPLTQIGPPSGALPVSAHEQTHALQNDFDQEMAQQIPLAKIKGARYLTMREMGGIDQERDIQAALGRVRPTNFHSLEALQVKLAGGTMLQAMRAFYNSRVAGRQMSAKQLVSARMAAVKGTLRLYNRGGHDSQPLDYIEQELIMQALQPLPAQQRKAISIAGGSFSLADMADLHRVGLLEIPKQTASNPAADALRVFREQFLPGIMAQQ